MWLMLFSVAFATIVAWSLARAVRQARLYESVEDGPPTAATIAPPPRVAIVVPVRNEGRNIAACVEGLLAQDYPRDRLTVVVVDDGSTDDTVSLIERIMRRTGRVRLLRSSALPPGWAGKPFACWRGALAVDADWLCFVDADTAASPGLIRTATAAARSRRLDMISLSPLQQMSGFFDRLVIPLGFLAIAATRDLGRVNRPDLPDASINGQCLLVRARSYFAVGGHAAVCDAICEDSALAGRLKRAGWRIALLGAERLIRTRMYGGAAEVWEGFSKNATETFGGPVRTLGVAVGVLTVGLSTVLLPAWGAMAAITDPSPLPWTAALLAGLTTLAVVSTNIALCRHFRISVVYAPLFPVGAVAGAAIAVHAVLCRRRGRVAWKGRVYSPAPARSGPDLLP